MTRSVRRSVGWSVCHTSLKGREITLPCSYRSTRLFLLFFKAQNIQHVHAQFDILEREV